MAAVAALPCDGLLVDLDGVVWVGRQVLPGVPEALAAVRARQVPVLFVTNDPGGTRAQYAQRLTAAGVPATAAEVLTSTHAAAQLIAAEEPPGTPVLVLGGRVLRDEARAAGLRLAARDQAATAGAVLIAGHDRFDYLELAAATIAGHHGARLYATGRDPTFPGPHGPLPATGAIVAAVEATTGKTATVAGKPEPGMFIAARRLLGSSRNPVMVGDRLDTDVAGAKAVGIASILVLTGSTDRAQLDGAAVRPDLVLPSLADLRLTDGGVITALPASSQDGER